MSTDPGKGSRGVEGRAARWLLQLSVLASVWGCSEPPPPVDLGDFATSTDLVALLPTAEVLTETALIDFGEDGSRSHLVKGWSRDVFTDGEARIVWAEGKSSEVEFTVLEPRDLQLVARVMPFSWPTAPAQVVGIELNGTEAGKIELAPGLQEYRLALPAATLVRGFNRLVLRYAYSNSPRGVDPESLDPRELAAGWDYLAFQYRRSLAGRAVGRHGEDLDLPHGTEVSFFLSVEESCCLGIAGLEAHGDRGRLAVRARFDEADWPETSELIEPASGPVTLCFGNTGPTRMQLTLAAEPVGPATDADGGLLVRHPKIRAREPEIQAAATAASENPEPNPDRPNVILYLVDTLRADHLGAYGYSREVSPEIDRLAADSLIFDDTWAQSSWTRCAVASILTGLLPSRHQTLGREDVLAPAAITLAEVLSDAGYETAAFVANPHVSDDFGFDQGFALFRRLGHQPPEPIYARSDEVHRNAVSWLEKSRDRPFFLYVHTMDPHAPYAPPPSVRSPGLAEVRQPDLDADGQLALDQFVRFHERSFGANPDLRKLGSVPWIHALDLGIVPITPRILGDLVALYDGEIAYNDHNLGSFLADLRKRDLYDSTLIVFVSDHGEEFLDHGRLTHGKTLYDDQLRVPLIVKLPGQGDTDDRGRPRRRRVASRAEHVDIFPTVLDLLGLEPPTPITGRSLVRDPPKSVANPGYAQLDFGGWHATAVIDGRDKLICTAAPSTCELYDLETDPGETVDLAREKPVLAGFLRRLLRAYRNPEGRLGAAEATIDPELDRSLRALGYN